MLAREFRWLPGLNPGWHCLAALPGLLVTGRCDGAARQWLRDWQFRLRGLT